MPNAFSTWFIAFHFILPWASVAVFSQDNKEKNAYYLFRNSDSSFYHANKIIAEAKDSSQYYYGRFVLGQCIYWQGYIDSSLIYYNEAEKYFGHARDSSALMEIYLEKGNALKVLSVYDQSYDYLMKAHRIAASLSSMRWQAFISIHLAEHARAMGNKENAVRFIERAFNIHNISALSGDDLAELYHRKAAIEHEYGNPAKAEEFSLLSLKISEPSGNLHQQATSYNELGYYYSNRGDEGKENKKALDYYFKAEKIWQQLNFRRYYIWVWRNIAREFGRANQLEKSNQLLKKILSVSEPNGWNMVSSDASQHAAANFEAMKKADSALVYYKKFLHYRQRADESARSKEFQDIIVKYATEQKEQMLKKQQEETELVKKEKEKTISQRNFILLLLASMIVLLAIIGYLTLKLKRKNILLSESSLQNAAMNRQLQSELSQKNILFAELHHRVKNNLAVLSGLINLQKDSVQDEVSKEILRDTQNRIHSIAMIHRSLYNVNNSENIDFEKYLKELAASLFSAYKKEKISFATELSGIFIDINKGVPLALIMNELISNSLKHAFGNRSHGMIRLSGRIESDLLHLSYSDDGPGFEVNFENLPVDSLGLQLIKILSEQLDAEYHYCPEKGKGTYTFLIPLHK